MMEGRKMTSEEKKKAIWKQRFEMDGKEMVSEWGYCVEDNMVDRFGIHGIQVG